MFGNGICHAANVSRFMCPRANPFFNTSPVKKKKEGKNMEEWFRKGSLVQFAFFLFLTQK
jgi:hypothetical protein